MVTGLFNPTFPSDQCDQGDAKARSRKEQFKNVQHVKRREFGVSADHTENEEAKDEQKSDSALAKAHLNPAVEVA
ncbi:MAG TPA: hypothetical protein VKF41_10955 [Bryobacteraceae bacterium]|nr:hypothetical protein [Bryobacteraceae bacterium]